MTTIDRGGFRYRLCRRFVFSDWPFLMASFLIYLALGGVWQVGKEVTDVRSGNADECRSALGMVEDRYNHC
jgi:hypothetical protein